MQENGNNHSCRDEIKCMLWGGCVLPVVILLLVVGLICLYIVIWGDAILIVPDPNRPLPEFVYDETLTIPLDSIEDVYSQDTYSGWIFFRFSGLGQVSEGIYSDAFCRYDEQGNRISRYEEESEYGIAVDDNIRLAFPNKNTYDFRSPDWGGPCSVESRIYVLGYHVGDEARHIVFRAVDPTIEDNSGAITVEITTNTPPLYQGR